VLCYTGEADGKYTGPIAKWSEVGPFFTSLARWTAGESGQLSDNMLVTQEVKSGLARIALHLDPERKADPFTDVPRVTMLRAESGEKPRPEQATLQWADADTLAIDVPLYGTETALATVAIPGQKPLSLPPVCLPYSPEYRPAAPGSGLAALERLARTTGGKERVDLAGIWGELPREPRLVELAPWLLIAAVVLLLVEVLERRTALLTSWWRRLGLWMPIRLPSRRQQQTGEPASEISPPEERRAIVPAVDEASEPGVLAAIREAKRRTRGGKG
jgi:hypothetical protein